MREYTEDELEARNKSTNVKRIVALQEERRNRAGAPRWRVLAAYHEDNAEASISTNTLDELEARATYQYHIDQDHYFAELQVLLPGYTPEDSWIIVESHGVEPPKATPALRRERRWGGQE